MRFYLTTQNSRGKEVTAGSHKGNTTHVRGWNSGIEVVSYVFEGKDCFMLYTTKGSNNSTVDKYIGALIDGKLQRAKRPNHGPLI